MAVSPPAGEGPRVGVAFGVVAWFGARGVGVVLGECPVRDHEHLHVVEKPVAGPEGLVLVAGDLVERFAEVDAAAFEFDVDERQPVDEDRDVIPVGVGRCTRCGSGVDGVLVDDLEFVVVDVGFVE